MREKLTMLDKLANYLVRHKKNRINFDEINAFCKSVWDDDEPYVSCPNPCAIITDMLNVLVKRGMIRKGPESYAGGFGALVPRYVNVIREKRQRFVLPENLELHPAMSFLPCLRSGETGRKTSLEMGYILNKWLLENGIPDRKIPLNEFSLMVFGDEKYLSRNKCFGGRLNPDTINVYRTTIPLVFRKTDGAPPNALVIENSETWAVLSDWNDREKRFSAVIYAAGNSISNQRHNLDDTLELCNAQNVFYFGDIDPKGMDIAVKSGCVPMIPMYEWLLDNGARRPGFAGKIKPVPKLLAKVKNWIPALYAKIEKLWLTEKAWIPQESLGASAIDDALEQNLDFLSVESKV